MDEKKPIASAEDTAGAEPIAEQDEQAAAIERFLEREQEPDPAPKPKKKRKKKKKPSPDKDDSTEEKDAEDAASDETDAEGSEAKDADSEDAASDDEDEDESSDKPLDRTTGGRLKKYRFAIIAGAAVLVLVGVMLLLLLLPKSAEGDTSETTYNPADITITVDSNGEHQAQVETTEKGEVQKNGTGTLVSYVPSQIREIVVENESGTFTVLSETPVVEQDGEEMTDTTVYTIVGFEDVELQDGTADNIADDAASIDFTSIASVSGNLSDFGFDDPRATVKVTYTDDTTATIILGDKAVSELGSYIKFGDSDAVYLVSDDAVDGFLYNVLDLFSTVVTEDAATVEDSELQKATISGGHYKDDIVLERNRDEAIKYEYAVTSPKKMFANVVESADITGAIRGLRAESVANVNPSDSTLAQFGIAEPYATIEAVYPDVTIRLSCSAPSDDGTVYLYNHAKRLIYTIQLAAIPWANTGLTKLTPETVLNISVEAVDAITMDAGSEHYEIDVTTTTEQVENTDGETEEVTSTVAYCDDQKLEDDDFNVFFQNLNNLKNTGDASDRGAVMFSVRIRYTTGRSDDVLTVYDSSDSKCVAELNGEVVGSIYKNNAKHMVESVDNLTKGSPVTNL